MNNTLVPPAQTGFRLYLSQSWAVCKDTSKGYRICMLVIMLGSIVVNASFLSSITTDTLAERQAFIMRSVLEPFMFLLVCHIFIRPYLKLKVIHHPYNLRSILKLVLVLLVVGFSYFSLTVFVAKLEPLNDANFEKLQMVTDSGEIDAVFGPFMLWFFGMLSSFTTFGTWTIFYLLYHQQLSRKILQKQVQKAQMQQLTNQLSPHFLFNTFNSIRALIYEDQDKAADTVTELSELFRVHLQAHLRVKSTLEEEWQVTERYLDIEQIRLEERLTVNNDIDPTLWQQNLPTLTLLTLIENAVKHGISPSSEEGYINIIAKPLNTTLWSLIVTNSFKPGTNTTGTQVGLANIQTRLRLMYGEHIPFEQTADNTQFKVSLTLPTVATKEKGESKGTADA